MIICTFEDGGKAGLRHTVVDTLVFRDHRLLMVKRAARLSEAGKWGLVGGYVDRDETLIKAARREILEETGWQVGELTLLAIVDNPNRPKEDRQNIAFVYFCKAVEKTGEPDDESDEQRWFAMDELPPLEQIAFDHAEHIKLYRKYLAEQFPLPLLNTT